MSRKAAQPIIIGVTGSFGTGKSTVAAMFRKFGVRVLDADKIAHGLMRKNTKTYKKIVKEFGGGILKGSGAIDRSKLADIVFCGRKMLGRLCGIIHPAVISELKKSIKHISKNPRVPAVMIDAPLLIEAGVHKMADVLLVAVVSAKVRMERARKKTGKSDAEIKRRIGNQMPLKKKAKMADYIIDNEGNKDNTRKIVKKIWKEIKGGRK